VLYALLFPISVLEMNDKGKKSKSRSGKRDILLLINSGGYRTGGTEAPCL